jgi:hypothetical protein
LHNIITPSSIVSNLDSKITVFPNPVIDLLYINISDNSVTNCQVFNINGQIIKTLKVEPGNNEYNLGNLETGIYLIKLQTTSGTKTYKIIKR